MKNGVKLRVPDKAAMTPKPPLYIRDESGILLVKTADGPCPVGQVKSLGLYVDGQRQPGKRKHLCGLLPLGHSPGQLPQDGSLNA